MTDSEVGDSLSLEGLMECARERALLDNWEFTENGVRLTVGTYEIELRRQDASQFVRSLLKTYEAALGQART